MKHLLWIFAALTLATTACIQTAQKQAEQEQTAAHDHAEPAEEAAAEARAIAGESGYPADSMGQGGRSFHGNRIDEGGAVPVSQITSLMDKQGGLSDVKIVGEVDAACQMKGCWMTMKLADGSDMRVRFKDYGFFVPKDCAGKNAVVKGKAFYDTTSVDMLRHYAVDGGMSEAEAEKKYTEPEVAIAFEATGVIIE